MSAFQETGVEELRLPASVQEIGPWAFYKCANLKTLILDVQTELRVVGKDAFGKSALREVYAPADLDSAVLAAFPTEVTVTKLPAKNTAACGRKLGWLRSLKSAQLPEGLKAIKTHWFTQSLVEEVFVSASVCTIESKAFYKCPGLRKVVMDFRCTLKQVGSNVFDDCPNLEVIFVPTG